MPYHNNATKYTHLILQKRQASLYLTALIIESNEAVVDMHKNNCTRIYLNRQIIMLLSQTKTYIHYPLKYMSIRHIYDMHVCLRWFSQTI